MTCGNKTCTTATYPIELTRAVDVPSCASWFSGFLARVILALRRTGYRRALVEFEKVERRGIAMDLYALRAAIARQRQRRRLLDLDDHLLADIGLTREDAEREARKPFWR